MTENSSSRSGASIVVGVDGSAGSLAALRWALREAQLRQAGVRAVFVWQYHPAWSEYGTSSMFPLGFGELRPGFGAELGAHPADPDVGPGGDRLREAESAAANVLDAAVTEVVESAESAGADPSAPITQQIVRGHPAAALLDTAADAELLVVGTRGHGTFTGALLGSISQHLVTHARCPVVVVPSERHENPDHAEAQA